ncbi:hypothetical protein [Phytohabitans houttuyneae]|nr:hypothetical protein [Phytohabitans houttuyneae]
MSRRVVALVAVLLLAGCTGTAGSPPAPVPSTPDTRVGGSTTPTSCSCR